MQNHLTIKQACTYFGVHRTTLHKWCKQGILNPVKVGGKVFLPIAGIERIMKGIYK